MEVPHMATVRLSAESKFGFHGQYIARIMGRAQKFQFQRSFVGRKSGKRNELTSYETDEIGLYEECDVGKNGATKTYALVLEYKDRLVKLYSDTEDALAIAKRLDGGELLADFVKIELGDVIMTTEWYGVCPTCDRELELNTICPDHPEAGRERKSREVPKLGESGKPLHQFVYRILPKVEAKKEAAAEPETAAVDAIAALLEALPAPLQRRALTAVRARLFPPKSEAAPEPEPEPEQASA